LRVGEMEKSKFCIVHKKYKKISRVEKPLNKIAISSTYKINKSSQKMLLSFGFKKMGVLKEIYYGGNEIFYSYELYLI